MNHGFNQFADRMTSVLGEPNCKHPESYLRELAGLLADFTADDLSEAATALFKTQRFKTWPLPAEIIAAATEARRHRLLLAGKGVSTNQGIDPFSAESKAVAYRLIKSDMGKEAAAANWINQLFSYCSLYRQLPSATDKHRLMDRANSFDQLYVKVGRDLEALASKPVEKRSAVGSWAPVGGSDAKLLRTCLNGMEHFLRERDRLAAFVNGESTEAAE